MSLTPAEIAIIGTGSWGTTLAIMLARHGRHVVLLARTASEAEILCSAGENTRYATGVPFPPTLAVEYQADLALRACQLLLLAVPSQTMRSNMEALQAYVPPESVILSCAKGLERGTLQCMSRVLASVMPDRAARIGTLSGPNIAREILQGKPATTVVATPDQEAAARAQRLLTTPQFRVYTSDDVIGIELAGALKNVVALGAGIADGLEAGNNAKAAFITRGLAEIARLGIVMGANPLTFAGLAGLGDLIATCASPYSRNRRLGEALARGLSLEAAQSQIGQVAEGVTTVQTARELASRHGVELPITDQLYQVLFEGKSLHDAVAELMQREVKHEFEDMRRLWGMDS